MSQQRVLVTGGFGRIGRALQSLYPDYTYLSSKDCNLLDYPSTIATFQRIQPTHIIHLAAVTSGNNNVDVLDTNLLININVLKACHQIGIQRIVCCLSAHVFSSQVPGFTLSEEQIHTCGPPISNKAFGYAKRMLEVACQFYNQEYNREYICVIPSNIYGDFDNFDVKEGHFLSSLIHQAYLLSNNDKSVLTIKNVKWLMPQYIHVKDVATLLVWTLFEYDAIHPLVLAPNEKGYPLEDIVSIICKEFRIKQIEYDSNCENTNVFKKSLSNAKFQQIYTQMKGQKYKFIPFEQGLVDTIRWFNNCQNTKNEEINIK